MSGHGYETAVGSFKQVLDIVVYANVMACKDL